MSYKYSMILGNLGNTCDRFCKGYKSNPTSEAMLDWDKEDLGILTDSVQIPIQVNSQGVLFCQYKLLSPTIYNDCRTILTRSQAQT